MSTKKKLLEAAAGNAAGDGAIYVDDVFSTDLWAGNDAEPRGIQNGIALGDFGYGTSTRFNGTGDHLSRSSDLTGNADGKTFTFSCWVFLPPMDNRAGNVNQRVLYATDSSDNGIAINVNSSGQLGIEAGDGSGSWRLQATASTVIGTNVWTHILVSVDMANSSNRYVYLNDVAASVTWNVYTDTNLDFTRSTHYIGVWGNGTARYFYDDMAHFYLDYTYRDLSTESNRRIFIDANGGSTSASSLAALNPIMYLPMTTAYAVGKNAGTGGDFTANGSPTIVENGTEYISGEGKGGLVWIKVRTASTNNDNHVWYSTDIGGSAGYLRASTTDSLVATGGQQPLEFNSNGFTMPVKSYFDRLNDNGYNFASWTFRKQPGFFDVVKYTGTGSARDIAHNLGSVPGMVIIKSLDKTYKWIVSHRSLANLSEYLSLNESTAKSTDANVFGSSSDSHTATTFHVGSDSYGNQSGDEYVAYLFAHDAQEFGTDSDEALIKCGSVTTTAGADFSTAVTASVDLGFEPQWILLKSANNSSGWFVVDTMRGIITPYADFSYLGNAAFLYANSTAAEADFGFVNVTPTGFNLYRLLGSTEYIYMAIRRPHKPASELAATDLFSARYGSNSADEFFFTGFDGDLIFSRDDVTGVQNNFFGSRLTGQKRASQRLLWSNDTAAETATSGRGYFGNNSKGYNYEDIKTSSLSYLLRRAPEFFDVVTYNGDGTNGRTVTHNLGVTPEMIIVKNRSTAENWFVYHSATGATKATYLNTTSPTATSAGFWNDTAPTSSVFSTYSAFTNVSNQSYIAYLFATVPGISKVGSYTGTGTSLDIDCGFTNGARLVLLRRTDINGNWFVWDTARGIVAGNDPYKILNDTTVQSTSGDYIDPYSAGFNLTGSGSSINGAGGSFIFLAIA